MIKFFRQSYIIQYIVLAVLSVALWIPAFVSGTVDLALTSPVTPLYNWISGLLDVSPLAMMITSFVLMILEALFFNSMLVANQIVPKVSTMGAFVFLLFCRGACQQTLAVLIFKSLDVAFKFAALFVQVILYARRLCFKG